MAYVERLDLAFDIAELQKALEDVLAICDWHPKHRQIGLTHSLGADAIGAWHDAAGSLTYVWGDDAIGDDGQLRRHTVIRSEHDFAWFVPEFTHTAFKSVYQRLTETYRLGRVRLMRINPRSCTSWHRDSEKRLHIPLVTNHGARLIIENESHHMPADGHVYIADTTMWHAAMNGGLEPRMHLVACLLP